MGYNKNEYENGVRGQLTSCECDRCGLEFKLTRRVLSTKIKQTNIYCSKNCSTEASKKQIEVVCGCCGINFLKTKSTLSKTANFCSKECYHNSLRVGDIPNEQEIMQAFENSSGWHEIYDKLKFGNKKWEKKFLNRVFKKLNLDSSKLTSAVGKTNVWRLAMKKVIKKVKTPIEEFLNNQKPIGSHRLKLKLFEANLKKRVCENCEQSKWLGNPIPVELHHIDGNRKNNCLSNLKILCPNCHALTENYAGKNIKSKERVCVSDDGLMAAVPLFYNKRQVLKSFNYEASGAGYSRLTKLLEVSPSIEFKKQGER